MADRKPPRVIHNPDLPEQMAYALHQPWASLFCSPRKIHETRSQPTKFRGWLVVHASKTFDRECRHLWDLLDDEFGTRWSIGQTLPTGCLIGMANIVDCQKAEDVYPFEPQGQKPDDYLCGNFEPGRFAWRKDGFRRFNRPIPYKGKQGFFRLNDDVAGQVRAIVERGEFVDG